MKKISVLFFFFLLNSLFSQTKTITGHVKDMITLKPVESVSISLDNSTIGTISNEEGAFRITLDNNSSTIQFSHLYYEIEKYTVKEGDSDIEIMLVPKAYELDEVTISKYSGKELLAMAVSASKDRLDKTLVLNTYYREFVNVDEKFTSFADGLVDFYVKRKSGKSDLEVKQSRVFDLKDENASERKKAILSVNLNDIQDAISHGYNFKGLSRILESDNYIFYSQTKKTKDENSIDIITFEPKEGVEEELIFVGTVVYDTKTKLILEVDMHYSPEHKKYSKLRNIIIAKIKFNDYARKAKYKIENDKYVLLYFQSKFNFYIKYGSLINNTFESTCDLTTLDFKEGEYKLEKERKYKETSLFMNGTKYTEEFWKKHNVILLSEKEENLLKSLQK